MTSSSMVASPLPRSQSCDNTCPRPYLQTAKFCSRIPLSGYPNMRWDGHDQENAETRRKTPSGQFGTHSMCSLAVPGRDQPESMSPLRLSSSTPVLRESLPYRTMWVQSPSLSFPTRTEAAATMKGGWELGQEANLQSNLIIIL